MNAYELLEDIDASRRLADRISRQAHGMACGFEVLREAADTQGHVHVMRHLKEAAEAAAQAHRLLERAEHLAAMAGANVPSA